MLHVEHGERHEDAQRDDLLQNLQLTEVHLRVADSVRRHLDQVLKERDSPTDQNRDQPRSTVKVFKCAYQANVMNTFDNTNNPAVFQNTGPIQIVSAISIVPT